MLLIIWSAIGEKEYPFNLITFILGTGSFNFANIFHCFHCFPRLSFGIAGSGDALALTVGEVRLQISGSTPTVC